VSIRARIIPTDPSDRKSPVFWWRSCSKALAMRRVGAVGRAHLSPPISAAGKLRKAIHCPPARALSRRSSRRTRRTPCPIPRSRRPCPRVSARRLFRRRPPWPSRINGTGVNQRSGASFNEGTFLQSAATLTAGTAAVSFAHLHADFTNTGASYPAIPGAVVSASGFLSPTAGSFVELAEQGTITIKNSSGQQVGSPDSFTMIAAFGYNSSLQFSSFVSGTGQMTLNAPNSQEDFSLTGTDLFGLTNITSGMGFSVDASLTLVSDPGSLIQLSSLSDVSVPLPNIGAFAGSAVPEPSSFVELRTALAC